MQYGVDPRVVLEWPESLFMEASIVLRGQAKYSVTESAIEEETEKRRKAMVVQGFVAGRDFSYWSQFIVDGVLDEEAAIARGGLTEEQVPEKREEMAALGWLDAPDRVDTAPLKVPEKPEEDEP